MQIKLYNTASRKVEDFEPLNPPLVTLYTCGPTVYYYTHVGHLRAYTNSDVLRRTLEYAGYNVRHVMNVTDVGHLTSDADEGEDKLEVGAKREKKTVWEIARFYEEHFFKTIAQTNILKPHVICRATEHIEEQINLIKQLEEKGFTYETSVGLTFDTSKFTRYAEFARLDLEGQQEGARVEIAKDKRNPQDFALWVTNKPTHIMMWDSPWGRGFPGWHLECSAMSQRYCGDTLDIHTGGIDHIPVHHTNEIAQSEGATGKCFAKYWFHTAFLNVDKTKMAKSLGNFYQLEDLAQKGFIPTVLRYFFFGSSYRKALNFTWEALGAADKALARLYEKVVNMPPPAAKPDEEAIKAFEEAVSDDLNMPRALAVVWDTVDKPATPERTAALMQMDKILGLELGCAVTRLSDRRLLLGGDSAKEQEAMEFALERQRMRKEKKFKEADELRDKIKEMGFTVEDTADGPRLKPIGSS